VSSTRILVTQGGSPTAVINESMVGVMLEARRHLDIHRVYGARHGVSGIANEDFVGLTQKTHRNLEFVAATPRWALGSTREKPDLAYYRKIFKPIRALAIKRKGSHGVDYELLPLAAVAGKTRTMEDESFGADVTDALRRSLQPLLGLGMPETHQLRAHRRVAALRP
jgi:hypothetical protein